VKTPQERADWVKAKHGKWFDKLINEAKGLLDAPAPFALRAKLVVRIIDDLAERVAPQSGCYNCREAHCCHQSVVITSWEAEQIAKYTKRKMAAVPDLAMDFDVKETRERYSGVPCPFLKKKICTIYEVRPATCRLHFNMSHDVSLCDIINNPGASVPMFNFQELSFIRMAMHHNEGCAVGHIHEFFPPTGPT